MLYSSVEGKKLPARWNWLVKDWRWLAARCGFLFWLPSLSYPLLGMQQLLLVLR